MTESNVIVAVFDPKFRMDTFLSIKYLGIKRTAHSLLESGLHPSFVKALIKNITRTMGW